MQSQSPDSRPHSKLALSLSCRRTAQSQRYVEVQMTRPTPQHHRQRGLTRTCVQLREHIRSSGASYWSLKKQSFCSTATAGRHQPLDHEFQSQKEDGSHDLRNVHCKLACFKLAGRPCGSLEGSWHRLDREHSRTVHGHDVACRSHAKFLPQTRCSHTYATA